MYYQVYLLYTAVYGHGGSVLHPASSRVHGLVWNDLDTFMKRE